MRGSLENQLGGSTMTDQQNPPTTTFEDTENHDDPTPTFIPGRNTAGLLDQQLEAIRKNAADWRTGLAGLLTLVTGALVFKAPGDIPDYPQFTQLILGLLAAAAAVSGAWGLWLLLLAANGSPRLVPANQAKNTHEAAKDAKRHLNLGRFLSVLSAFLVLALITLAWYSPKAAKDPPAFIRITESSETSGETEVTRCGTLKVADSKGITYLVSGEREQRTVVPNRLVSIELVDTCQG